MKTVLEKTGTKFSFCSRKKLTYDVAIPLPMKVEFGNATIKTNNMFDSNELTIQIY